MNNSGVLELLLDGVVGLDGLVNGASLGDMLLVAAGREHLVGLGQGGVRALRVVSLGEELLLRS